MCQQDLLLPINTGLNIKGYHMSYGLDYTEYVLYLGSIILTDTSLGQNDQTCVPKVSS